jgi:hypothetical protein
LFSFEYLFYRVNSLPIADWVVGVGGASALAETGLTISELEGFANEQLQQLQSSPNND